MISGPDHFMCDGCSYSPQAFAHDPVYINSTRPLMYFCASLLPIGYIIGLIFTHKTHKDIIDKGQHLADQTVIDFRNYERNEKKQKSVEDTNETEVLNNATSAHGVEEGAPVWSKTRCIIILLICIGLTTLVSETISKVLEHATHQIGLSQRFAGASIVTLVPDIPELINAVRFALDDNIALSFELGYSNGIQIAMIQVPFVVFMSGLVINPSKEKQGEKIFSMIFSNIDIYCILMAVIIITYASNDGRTNYFTGAMFIMFYACMLAGFYFVPDAINY